MTVEEAAHVRDDVEAGIDAVAIVHQNRRGAGFGDRVRHSGISLQSQTSLTTLAPISVARRATLALEVSIENGISMELVSAPRMGSSRASSSSGSTGVWPGRVDSAPHR